ncbi:hypothetical protein I4U23_004368 [Adineta vaga]|nr:hypothetical protein I4U23_004368 [Adineta vaga]
MNSKTILFITIVCLLLFNSISSYDNGTDVHVVEKRRSRGKCVRCSLGVFKCCEPDICVKHRLGRDKCKRIKVPH